MKGLRTEQRTITVEDRVVILTQVKAVSWFRERGIEAAARSLVPGQVSVKQFQQVPRADIEMLLPSTQVRFRPIDSLLVGLPAVASGIAVLATKLLPTLGLIFVLIGAWLGLRDDQPEMNQGALVVLFGGLITPSWRSSTSWRRTAPAQSPAFRSPRPTRLPLGGPVPAPVGPSDRPGHQALIDPAGVDAHRVAVSPGRTSTTCCLRCPCS